MAGTTVPPRRDAERLAGLLDSPELRRLIRDLEATRWTGRPGYPIRAMVGMTLVKSLYALPTWTRVTALVNEHAALRATLGCAPSVYACYRFTAKLREHSDTLDRCLADVLASLHDETPEMGKHIAIDGSDLPAYANGQRYVSKGGRLRERFSDPDASWGHRSSISTRSGGGFYGYKVHAAICTETGLPLAWEVHTAKDAEVPIVPNLLNALTARGFSPVHAMLDKGYDANTIYETCEARGIRPIIPLRQTPAVKAGKAAPPECEHGTWTFAGSDAKRDASKWRCPTGECQPASRWVRADRLHPLIPRESKRYKALYHQRGAVEREFGRLKHEWALLPLRVRRIERVRLHADLSILGRLTVALDKARAALPMAA
jgi:transposase, IS5 family